MSVAATEQPGRIRRYWLLALLSFVGWSLLAAIPTTSAYIGTGAQGLPVWWSMFSKIGLYYYMWGLLAPFIYRLTDTLPYRGRGLLLTVPLHLVVLVALSFGLGLIAHQEAWREWLIGARAAGFHSMSAFTYALIVLCCLAIKFYRLSLLRQREVSDARLLAAELDSRLNLARVDSLRMQMNPHFLFNALNSVAALIDADKRDLAYRAVEQLGDLLRRALGLSRASQVTLDEELQFSEAYLSLEQIRFGDRLQVRWEIADAARAQEVPAFVLQPLIENAVRHAVGPSATQVTVTVRAELAGDVLELEVADDGACGGNGRAVDGAGRADEGRRARGDREGRAPAGPATDESATAGAGVGLANLRERLTLRYGQAARVESHGGAGGYSTLIHIPRQPPATVRAP